MTICATILAFRKIDLAPTDDPGDVFAAVVDETGPRATKHDNALSFHWATPDFDWQAALQLPPAATAKRKMAHDSILTAAYRAYQNEPGRWTSYSRGKSWYTGKHRYQGPAFTYTAVTWAVDSLVRDGWLEGRPAKRGSRGWQSTFRATPRLIHAITAPITIKYSPPERSLIQLKDEKKRRIDFRETTFTLQARRNVIMLNEGLRSITVTCTTGSQVPNSQAILFTKDTGGSVLIDVGRDQYYRVFNRSFSEGGRWYGPFWQSMPKRDRAALLINGDPVAEPDFRFFHPRLLYARIGIELRDDPYNSNWWPREVVKRAFNTMVNCDNALQAERAIARQVRGKGAFARARQLMEMIQQRHPLIAHFFCNGAARWLQRIDSDIAEQVMLRALREGIPTLGIHDSFITPVRYEGRVLELMDDAFARASRMLRQSAPDQQMSLAA